MNVQEEEGIFPLSKLTSVKGSRKLARIKVIQILYSFLMNEDNLDRDFNHIFYRDFNFGDNEEKHEKLLKTSEVYELEADIPIIWDDSEKEFAQDLIRIILNNLEKVEELIKGCLENWEFERICLIDKLIIAMAVSELLYFPDIPSKVSLNEAVETAKKLSTDKSGHFINGIINNLYRQFDKDNLLQKKGRGLKTSRNEKI